MDESSAAAHAPANTPMCGQAVADVATEAGAGKSGSQDLQLTLPLVYFAFPD